MDRTMQQLISSSIADSSRHSNVKIAQIMIDKAMKLSNIWKQIMTISQDYKKKLTMITTQARRMVSHFH